MYDCLLSQESRELFIGGGIMNETELAVRHTVLKERHRFLKLIEWECLLQICNKHISGFCAKQLAAFSGLRRDLNEEITLVQEYESAARQYFSALCGFSEEIEDVRAGKLDDISGSELKLVQLINYLEAHTSKEIWLLPDYSEILNYNAL